MNFLCSAQNDADTGKQAVTRNIGNQVIRKGHMSIQNMSRIKGVSKTFWFVLTTESLSWYKEEDERDKHFMLALDDLKLRDIEQGFMSRRYSYALVNPNGRNVYRVSNCLPCSI